MQTIVNIASPEEARDNCRKNAKMQISLKMPATKHTVLDIAFRKRSHKQKIYEKEKAVDMNFVRVFFILLSFIAE